MDWSTQAAVLVEVALAMILGGFIGLEREIANKPAGYRTHMLVAGAAALLVGLSDTLVERFQTGPYGELVQSDPIRIIQAIIAGISFLGAGVIFRHTRTQNIEGLTTAASLLFSGAIGICVALRQFFLAAGVTILTVFVLRGLQFVERRLVKRNAEGDKRP